MSRWILLSFFTIMAIVASNRDVAAVPSFARQTGMSCSACHTAFPELKPFGRAFKLGGYVFSENDKLYEFPPPVAGMAQVSFTDIGKVVPPRFIKHNWATNTLSGHNDAILQAPQQLSLFYAGKIFWKFGSFIQATFDGAGNDLTADNMDIRGAYKFDLMGKDLVLGATVNNAPTVEDIWNSTPVWGFPYASSSVAPGPAAAAVVDGGLNQQVGGIGTYLFWNNLLYLESTLFRTAQHGIVQPMALGPPVDTVVDDMVPYWRAALQRQWEKHSVEVGAYGLVARIFPDGAGNGPTDRFSDIAFDSQYQYISGGHTATAHATWIYEKQDWSASHDSGDTAHGSDHLNTFKINGDYYYTSEWGQLGGALAFFLTDGNGDELLYSPDPVEGSRTGKPDTNGLVYELNYFPWEYTKLSVQYTMYNKFNGACSNYDGFGRNAYDNNTLYLLVWQMF